MGDAHWTPTQTGSSPRLDFNPEMIVGPPSRYFEPVTTRLRYQRGITKKALCQNEGATQCGNEFAAMPMRKRLRARRRGHAPQGGADMQRRSEKTRQERFNPCRCNALTFRPRIRLKLQSVSFSPSSVSLREKWQSRDGPCSNRSRDPQVLVLGGGWGEWLRREGEADPHLRDPGHERAGRSMRWATTRGGWFVRLLSLAAAGAAGLGMALVAIPTISPHLRDARNGHAPQRRSVPAARIIHVIPTYR